MRRKAATASPRHSRRRVEHHTRRMPTLKTTAALKRLIQLRIDALTEAADEGDQVFARDVDWHPPDENGCNWDMHGFRGPAGYATEIRLIVNNLRRAYRLSDEPAPWSVSP